MLTVAVAARTHASAQEPESGAGPAAPPPSPPQAQPSALSVTVARTESPPAIDGRLDDECWASAPVFSNFTQVLPVEGGAPSETTEVRVVFDADNLYIAVRCFDSDARGIIARQM